MTRDTLEELLDHYKAEVTSFEEQNQVPVEVSRNRIAASSRLAGQIAAAMLMCEPDELEDGDVDDAIGEFLNLLVGSAKTGATSDDDPCGLSPPRGDGFPGEGFGLYLVTNRGPGCLVIQTQPASE